MASLGKLAGQQQAHALQQRGLCRAARTPRLPTARLRAHLPAYPCLQCDDGSGSWKKKVCWIKNLYVVHGAAIFVSAGVFP